MRRGLAIAVLAAVLPACGQLWAVPVRFEAVSGSSSSGKVATLRLVPQDSSAQAISATLAIPGEVVVDVPAATTWQVLAEAEDLWSAPRWIAPGPDGAVRSELVRFFPAATVTGTLDAHAQEALPRTVGLRLEASPGATSPKPALTLLECPVQERRFRCTVPAGRLDLRLRAGSFVPSYLWDVEPPAGGVLDLGSFLLKTGSSVVGWVSQEDGKPAAEATVRLEPQTLGLPEERRQLQGLSALALETRTNARGFFQLTEAAPGTYVLSAAHPGLVPASRPGIEIRPELEAQILDPLVLARPLSVRLSLDPPSAPSGNPWQLSLSAAPEIEGLPGRVFRGEATAEGTWQGNGLSQGRYTLSLADGDLRWSIEGLEVAPERTELQVKVPGLRILGRVHLGAEPLQATLWFGSRSAARRARFVSDEEGRFEGLLPEEGIWGVELVSAADGLRLKLDSVEVRKLPGAADAKVDIRIPNTRVRGRVVDERGQPVAEASILLTSFGRPASAAESDSEGLFEVRGLPAGDLLLRAEKEESESEWQQARLEEDRDSPEMRLVLQRRITVHGQVLSNRGPVPGAHVQAMGELGAARAASGDQAVSGAAGEFTLKLPAGTHRIYLSVLAPGYATRMIVVPVAADPAVQIALEPVGGTLVFDFGALTRQEILRLGAGLLFHGGAFVPLGEAVRWSQMQRSPQPDPHRLTLPNMEPGEYLLCVGGVGAGGEEPPAHQCSRGSLHPLQELVLALPPIPPEHLERLRPSRSRPVF